MEALLSCLHALEIIVLIFLKIRPRVFTGELLPSEKFFFVILQFHQKSNLAIVLLFV